MNAAEITALATGIPSIVTALVALWKAIASEKALIAHITSEKDGK